VPLRVSHEPRLYVDEQDSRCGRSSAPIQGRVDSELTRSAHSTYNINGWVPNPLFRVERPPLAGERTVVKWRALMARPMTTPGVLVDHALEAEPPPARPLLCRCARTASRRRAVAGTHSGRLAELGFDGDVNRAGGVPPVGARFGRPGVVLRLAADDLCGPMALDGFRFPPGAIALHIHSFFRPDAPLDDSRLVRTLVARGVTATIGNVFEPYLQLTLAAAARAGR